MAAGGEEEMAPSGGDQWATLRAQLARRVLGGDLDRMSVGSLRRDFRPSHPILVSKDPSVRSRFAQMVGDLLFERRRADGEALERIRLRRALKRMATPRPRETDDGAELQALRRRIRRLFGTDALPRGWYKQFWRDRMMEGIDERNLVSSPRRRAPPRSARRPSGT